MTKEERRHYNFINKEKINIRARIYVKNHPEVPAAASRKFRKTPKGYYQNYKDSARKRGYAFTLSLEQFLSFWQKNCIVGCPIKTIGLDRIDNSKGYEIDNVRPMCRKHNQMKMCWSDAELIEFTDALSGKLYGNS